jgi:hypothetical protein
MNGYIGYTMTMAIFIACNIAGWIIAVASKRRDWFKISVLPILAAMSILILVLSLLFKAIPGSNQLFVVIGVSLHLVTNPYFITNGGIAVGSNPVQVHNLYKYINLFSIILMAIGNYIVWFEDIYPPWALMLVILIITYVVILIPPRQAIITQQLFYGYKSVARRQ